jgi:hypothetical protein
MTEIILLLVMVSLTVGNAFLLLVVYYFINRNWEKLLELQNEINSIGYISNFTRGFKDD